MGATLVCFHGSRSVDREDERGGEREDGGGNEREVEGGEEREGERGDCKQFGRLTIQIGAVRRERSILLRFLLIPWMMTEA